MDLSDPRTRRSRELLRHTARELLRSRKAGEGRPLRFNEVAAAAGLNRSTVHSHFATAEDLVVDALMPEFDSMVGPMGSCPFDEPGTPTQIVSMFEAAGRAADLIACLTAVERAAATHVVAGRLEEAVRRARPTSGTHEERSALRFLAGGLARLLLEPDSAGVRGRADEAWSFVRAVLVRGDAAPDHPSADEHGPLRPRR